MTAEPPSEPASSVPDTASSLAPSGRGVFFQMAHPLLLSIYIPLFLFAHNFYQVYASELVVPLALFLLAGTLVFISARLIVGSWPKSAALSSTVLFFLFFYGFIVTEENKTIISTLLAWRWIVLVAVALLTLLLFISRKGRSAVRGILGRVLRKRMLLFVVGFAVVAAGTLAILASQMRIHVFHVLPLSVWILLAISVCTIISTFNAYEALNKVLTLFILILISISLGQIAYSAATFHAEVTTADNTGPAAQIDIGTLPDIYYIIPDEYAGHDTLQKMYGFSNDEFLGWLRSRDFYVVNDSSSNYDKTHLSIPSTLNLNFIDQLINATDLQQTDTLLEQLAKNNLVVKTLKANGYTYINVGSRWSLTGKNPNADISYSYEGLSHFNALLVESTILRAYNSPARVFDFDIVKEIPEIQRSPKFVFAHMPVPHVPFIYDREGNVLPAEEWYNFDNYLGQLLFINKKLEEIISSILEKTKRPVVILLQSDHGFRFCGKVSSPLTDCARVDGKNNLAAYYFSDGDYSDLYEGITPVNSFRVIFNKYLKTNYSMLPDRTDFASMPLSGD